MRAEPLAPGTPTLERLLARIPALAGAAVVARERNVYATTHPSEIVELRLRDGLPLRVFCKLARRDAETPGHRDLDPLYELATYRRILAGSPVRTPRLFGSLARPARGEALLVLEHVEGARLNHLVDPGAGMRAAAAWLGCFHAYGARRARRPPRFLRRFDAAYYAERLARMRRNLAPLEASHGWIADVAAGFPAAARELLAAEQTVIHGEFYPKNILCRPGAAIPIDWETAALAAGELDLAMLTERWPEEVARECIGIYARTRGMDPADLARPLAAARLYLAVHWLGFAHDPSHPRWGVSADGGRRLGELRRGAEALGLL
jgi:Ser/Thr protein kinase RdoA (MazF antagonist)